MILLATLLWPALATSLLLGAGSGWLAGLPRTRGARGSALALVLATVACTGLALAGPVPGRPGLWIEGAALLLAAYLAGAVLTAGATGRTSARP